MEFIHVHLQQLTIHKASTVQAACEFRHLNSSTGSSSLPLKGGTVSINSDTLVYQMQPAVAIFCNKITIYMRDDFLFTTMLETKLVLVAHEG